MYVCMYVGVFVYMYLGVFLYVDNAAVTPTMFAPSSQFVSFIFGSIVNEEIFMTHYKQTIVHLTPVL